MGVRAGPARRFRGLDRAIVLGVEVPVAHRLASRLIGLALLSRERAGPGLLLPRCHSVHTFGMRFELELWFLDARAERIEVRPSVPPARVARCPRAAAVLELPAGAAQGEAAIRSEQAPGEVGGEPRWSPP